MPDDQNASPNPPHLYERLGGQGGIALIVDRWLDRMAADPKLAPHLGGHDRDKFRQKQTDLLIRAFRGNLAPGGAAAAGDSEREAARRFERILSHLIAALVWANVSRQVIEEVLDLLERLRPELL